MTRRGRVPVLASLVLAGTAVALAMVAHGAADDPAPKPVAQIKHVMLSVNDTGNDTSLVSLLGADLKKDKLDDEGWDLAAGRAAMVAEAGNVLLGLKPPAGAADAAGLAKWKKHVVDYRGCAEEALAAIGKKDAAAAKAAFTNLNKRCSECHKDHRAE
jgi:hypothetical protein